MDTTIGKRLKEFRIRKNIKMPAIAAATGISKENLYKWEKGTKPSDITLYNKLIEYMDKMDNMPDHILHDPKNNGSHSAQPPSRSLLTGIFLSQDEDPFPWLDENAAPGNIIAMSDKPILIARRNDSSIIGVVDGLIQVTGDSMDPRYKSGYWIALKKLRFTKILNAGFCYFIIDKNLQGLLRKVQPSIENNSVTLLSENETMYPSITKSMDDILAIFSIEGSIIKQ